MLSRHHSFYKEFLQLVDAILIGASIWLAHALRVYLGSEFLALDNNSGTFQFDNCYWMIALSLPLGPLLLEYAGLYQTHPPVTWARSIGQIMWALFLLLVILFASVVVFHIPMALISREALGLFLIVGTIVLSIRSAIFLTWLRQRGSRLHLRQYILLCGVPQDRQQWKNLFLNQPGRGFEIKAELDLRHEGLQRFVEIVHEHTVDIVVFSLNESSIPQVREALLACETEGVEAWISADFMQTPSTNVQFDQFAGHPLLIYRTTPTISYSLAAKRFLDVVGSAILLILAAPIMVIVAVLIRATTPGPAIFSQNRSGLHGRPFRMYKFRSMVTNAEQARAELEARNEMSGPVFKVKDDPRVTPLGHWLRKTSLDELPQLWNVLQGEMSLVGPRPLPLYETANFADVSQRRRMSMRPGLTCLWQVRGRSKISDFNDWVRLDLEYIDRWSLWLDFEILLRTIPVVLVGWGAK
jgi:exopolysaccharide biosynthesis polyprenyl glycosylphosphotransferase